MGSVSLLVVLGSCTSYPVSPAAYTVGRNLVATVEVKQEVDEFDFPGGDVATGLIVEIQEIHWIGHPEPWIKELPQVAVGEELRTLRLPKSDYRVGEEYVASFSYIDDPAYADFSWWLSSGIDMQGNVITNKGDPGGFGEILAIADAVDGDTDEAGALLAAYASEMEIMLNARDSGTTEYELPLGPMLTAIYEEYGWINEGPTESPSETFLSASPDLRVLPSDALDAPDLLEEAGLALRVDWVQLEGIVIQGPGASDLYSIAFWFDGIARTSEYVVDHQAGATIFRSVAPVAKSFELVGFLPPLEEAEGSRIWDVTLAEISEPIPANGSQDTMPTQYLLVDLHQEPRMEYLTEDAYIQLVLEMQPILESGKQSGGEEGYGAE